jgi:hypothetical protein
MDEVEVPVVVQQTELITQGVQSCLPIMGTIERPPIQKSILSTAPQPTIEVTITYAYRQQVRHEFKKSPFVDDKLK